jgi:prepilin signal peptidase PulO-like enzyme (type II secretory pathway)
MSLTSAAYVSLEAFILFALLGLIVGSFLNVLIHRLPVMIFESESQAASAFNLMTPRSHCPHCHQVLHGLELIPLISFVCLKGRCRHCKQSISLRYPIVEVITAVMFLMCLQ